MELVSVEIMDQYELWDNVHDSHVYMNIVKGMYSLRQEVILAYKKLVNHLNPYGYEQCKFTQVLWTRKKMV